MTELDRFEARLAAAVQSFADGAETRVDATDVAAQTIRQHRHLGAWLARAVPVPVYAILVLGLLGGLLVGSQVGGPWDQRGPFIASPTSAPTVIPTPVPTTDGQGDEHVVGTASFDLTTPYLKSFVGDVTQARGGVGTWTFTMNDERVSGTATYPFSVDIYGLVGTEWGSLSLAAAEGGWDGPCSGGVWDDGDGLLLSCWLTGSGAYEGYTYHLAVNRAVGGPVVAEGIVYPGAALED